MTTLRVTLVALASVLLVSGCSQSDRDHFWSEAGDWSTFQPSTGNYSPSAYATRQRAAQVGCVNRGGTPWGGACVR